MKTLRIVNEKGCVYIERNFFRRWWRRMKSPVFRTNIEAYNWVKRQDARLVTKR